MKFAIRDDDTCYFTKPEDLQEAYDFLTQGPVSLSIVPRTVPYHSRGSAPYGEHPAGEYPITDNPALCAYLRQQIAAGRFDPLLHGYSHEYRQADGQWTAEMLWKDEARLRQELSAGRQLLEETLAHPVNVFVAPNNKIDQKGIAVLEELGMDFSGIIQHRDRKVTPAYLKNYVKRWSCRAIHGVQYGGLLDYGRHRELAALTLDSFSRLQKAYVLCKKNHWPFVVYTHYWTLTKGSAERRLLEDVYHMAMDDGAELVGLSTLFSRTARTN